MSVGLTITVEDIRAAKMCVRGAKQWFALHKLDFADFLAHGISEERLVALNDEMANRAIEVAKLRAAGEDE